MVQQAETEAQKSAPSQGAFFHAEKEILFQSNGFPVVLFLHIHNDAL